MKIINHDFRTGANTSRMMPVQARTAWQSYKRASGGEDYADISPEARNRFSKAEIFNLADQRIKKAAAGNIRESISETAGFENLKIRIAEGRYDFDENDLLAKTADLVSAVNFGKGL